jgi:hypothetical protein
MLQVEIRIKGRINPQRSDWFDELTINQSDFNETIAEQVWGRKLHTIPHPIIYLPWKSTGQSWCWFRV